MNPWTIVVGLLALNLEGCTTFSDAGPRQFDRAEKESTRCEGPTGIVAWRFAEGETALNHLLGDDLLAAVRSGKSLGEIEEQFGEERPPTRRVNGRMSQLLNESFHSGSGPLEPRWKRHYHQYGITLEFDYDQLPVRPSTLTPERVSGLIQP